MRAVSDRSSSTMAKCKTMHHVQHMKWLNIEGKKKQSRIAAVTKASKICTSSMEVWHLR